MGRSPRVARFVLTAMLVAGAAATRAASGEPVGDPVFADDFESGECHLWSATHQPVGAPDDDVDLYGDASQPAAWCQLPAGWRANALDCDDTDPDVHPGALELCNGVDDDCAAGTLDGAADPEVGASCDGDFDTDLCLEGATVCSAGALVCDDATGSTTDLCNGVDDDCDPASADGAEDPLAGQSCDGPGDSDLCLEGTSVCQAESIVCSDSTSSTLDLCNGADDDCDAASVDGSEDPLVGLGCDGPGDTDLCVEGVAFCSAGTLLCSDTSGSTAEVCAGDGADEDCDGEVDEGFPRNGNPVCASAAIDLGPISGDTGSGVLTHAHSDERWLTFTLSENNDGNVPLGASVTLYSPPGVDFDLYLYCASCPGAAPVASSTVTSLAGHEDVVRPRWTDDWITGEDDTYDVVVEVRHKSSSYCAPWTLTVQGNVDLTGYPDTCNP